MKVIIFLLSLFSFLIIPFHPTIILFNTSSSVPFSHFCHLVTSFLPSVINCPLFSALPGTRPHVVPIPVFTSFTVFTPLFSFSFRPFTSLPVPFLHTFSPSVFLHLPSSSIPSLQFSHLLILFILLLSAPLRFTFLSPPLKLSSSSPYPLSYFSSPPLLHSSSPLCISPVIQFTCVFPFQILSPCITSEFLLGTPVDYLCALVSIHACSYFLPAPAHIAAQDSGINNQALQAFGARDIW